MQVPGAGTGVRDPTGTPHPGQEQNGVLQVSSKKIMPASQQGQAGLQPPGAILSQDVKNLQISLTP